MQKITLYDWTFNWDHKPGLWQLFRISSDIKVPIKYNIQYIVLQTIVGQRLTKQQVQSLPQDYDYILSYQSFYDSNGRQDSTPARFECIKEKHILNPKYEEEVNTYNQYAIIVKQEHAKWDVMKKQYDLNLQKARTQRRRKEYLELHKEFGNGTN